MSKTNNNETDESMWTFIPAGLSKAIREIEEDAEKAVAYYGAYLMIIDVYLDRRGQKDYVTFSQIVDYYELEEEAKVKLLEDVTSCKWVFHTKKIEGSTDIMVKPVIVVDDMTQEQCEGILQAMKQKDYERLLELSPKIGEGKNLVKS